jgi:protein SCO1/2
VLEALRAAPGAVVTDDEAWLEGLEKTGWAALPEKPAGTEPAAFKLLGNGEQVPDETLIGQDGQAFRLSSLRGHPVLLTFIYTRCPLPNFCPLMDRQFQAVQQAIQAGRLSGGVRLLSVSFDPDFDTPAVLAAHAGRVGANPRIWTFATAPRARVEALGGVLGLSVIRDEATPSSITHNLRTAVIDGRGRLVTILNGNDWTPAQAISALASAAAS